MFEAHDTIDMSLVGKNYALTPVLSTELVLDDVVLAGLGSRMMSPLKLNKDQLASISKLPLHMVMKLARV